MGSRPHTEALIAWLEADELLAGRVFDGRVVGAAPQGYVIVFPHRPEHESSRMADRRRENRVRFTIHSVGVMPVQAEWFADRVQARLTAAPVRLAVGGTVQGIVEAVFEHVVYDRATGQLVTASFLDYGLPTPTETPNLHAEIKEVPTASNPLGVKGAGEAGITPAAAVIVSAAVDALRPFGVRHLDTPLTPERVWNAMSAGGSERS